jgi:hypothetical protein
VQLQFLAGLRQKFFTINNVQLPELVLENICLATARTMSCTSLSAGFLESNVGNTYMSVVYEQLFTVNPVSHYFRLQDREPLRYFNTYQIPAI